MLLGDSVFDNAAYVPRGEAVIDHLRSELADTGFSSAWATCSTTWSHTR